MDLFVAASKTFSFLALPSHVLFWLTAGTAAAHAVGRLKVARALAIAATVLFVVIGIAPTGLMAQRPLEDLYPRRPLPPHVDGILVLGSGLGVSQLVTRGVPGSTPGLSRIVSTFELSRQHPEARVVFSGGGVEYPDVIAARSDFMRLGLDPSRLVLEGRSRNTYQNFAFSKALVHPRVGETWVLATSAIQMPRAMRVAEQVGWPLIAWPTDYRTPAAGTSLRGTWFRIGANLAMADEALHEWVGMVGYRLAGRGR